ncbi:MAG: AAA family ATPase [Clostridia bacterium]|nr:AAA family ATPase [Clostridia bacterium]
MKMNLTPREIVNQLDKYIIGQDKAKRAVAVALRNRYRRSKLSEEDREEITPKNIIMKGPTGVGKTEIARRLARLVKAPFIKVEATKYTEVGYVGRDVESMVRDLVEASVRMVKEENYALVSERATKIAEKQLVKVIADALKGEQGETPDEIFKSNILEGLRTGKYDDMTVEVDLVEEPKALDIGGGINPEITIGSIFGGILPKKRKKRKVKVSEALKSIIA